MSEFYDSYETTQSIDVTPPKGLVEGASGPCSSLDKLICTLNEAKGLRITLPEGTDPARVETALHEYLKDLGLTDDVTAFGLSGIFGDSLKVSESPFGPIVHLTQDGTATPIPVSLYTRLVGGILKGEELEDMFPLKHVDIRRTKKSLLEGVEDEYLQNLGWGSIIAAIFDGRYKENEDELQIFNQEGELFIQVQLDRTTSAKIEEVVDVYTELPLYGQVPFALVCGATALTPILVAILGGRQIFEQMFRSSILDAQIRSADKKRAKQAVLDRKAARAAEIYAGFDHSSNGGEKVAQLLARNPVDAAELHLQNEVAKRDRLAQIGVDYEIQPFLRNPGVDERAIPLPKKAPRPRHRGLRTRLLKDVRQEPYRSIGRKSRQQLKLDYPELYALVLQSEYQPGTLDEFQQDNLAWLDYHYDLNESHGNALGWLKKAKKR